MAFDSLFIGVTGLEAYQSAIDTISNNIANTGTTGFKGQDVNFQDLIYQAQSFASAPTQTNGGVNGQDLGLGVKIGSVDTNFSQGGLQTTGVNTNLALNGDGFFILRKPNGNSAPVYTRNGDFTLNSNGLLYDQSSGMAVQGYMANANGIVNGTGVPGDMTIPLGLKSQAIGTGLNAALKFGANNDQVFDVSLGGNLDQTQWIKEDQGFQQTGKPGQGSPYTISTTVYDSLGVGHLASITYTPDATGAVAGAGTTTNAAVNGGADNLIDNPNISGATALKTITVTVNATGTAATVSDGGANTINNVSPGQSITMDGVTFKVGQFVAADNGKTANIAVTTVAKNGLPGQVADGSGTLHSVGSRWSVSVSFTDGTQFSTITTPGNGATAPGFSNNTSSGIVGYAYFDQNGQYVNTSSYTDGTPPAVGQPTILSGAAVHSTGAGTTLTDGNQLNITAWGTGNTNASTAPTAGGPAPATGPIGLDFHDTTSLAASTQTQANGSSATVLAQNGYAAGILSNITVGQDG
ncbi:MAG: flagellar hook-basal body complex protein, partial [Candidatus Eremiobacteraeota bacterium]|nr:flagellar hook-basal body complex protein [Candidatus Eremiobacteraeota bacterium]